MKIGVLALQGDFEEHIHILEHIGVLAVDVRLPESQAVHKPVVVYQSWSRAAQAYKKLTNEILDRFGES